MNKRIYTVILSLLAITQAFSQENNYEKLLVDGRKWNVAEIQYGDTINQWTDRIDYEVEFQGKKCFKVSRIYSDLVMEMFPELTLQHLYMYEEEGRVYVTNDYEPDAKWEKSFDFTLKPGEEGCVAVDFIKVNGTLRRRLYMDYMNKKAIWVEGIGNINYGLSAYGNGDAVKPTTGEVVLASIYDREQIMYTYNDLKNIADGINTVIVKTCTNKLSYDLYGRRLNTQPQRGLYIREGRKYVVK